MRASPWRGRWGMKSSQGQLMDVNDSSLCECLRDPKTHGPGSYHLWLFSWYISISDFAASSQAFSPRTTSGILSGGIRWHLSTLFWVDLFLSGPLDADLPFWPDRCMSFHIFNFFILKIPPCTSMINQTLKWERRKRDIHFHLGIKKQQSFFFFF